MLEVKHVAFVLLPRTEELLEGALFVLQQGEEYNKQSLMKTLEEILQLVKESKAVLIEPALINSSKIPENSPFPRQ